MGRRSGQAYLMICSPHHPALEAYRNDFNFAFPDYDILANIILHKLRLQCDKAACVADGLGKYLKVL